MGWETPLMERHAAIICASGGDVLNVGFGMGIIDGFIQTHKVCSTVEQRAAMQECKTQIQFMPGAPKGSACTCTASSTCLPPALSLMQPRTHTIIEAHPDVYKYACSQGWDRKPGVNLVHGRWQDVIDQVGWTGSAWIARHSRLAPLLRGKCDCSWLAV